MPKLLKILLVALLILAGLAGFVFWSAGGDVISHHSATADVPANQQRNILFLAGRDSHAAGEHEHKAGAQTLAAALREREPSTTTTIVYGGWPKDERVFDNIDALVMYCDGGIWHPMNRHLPRFRELLQRKVGVVALHYCVEAPKGSESATALLQAIGGYFETDWSVNPHWEGQFNTLPEHPVAAGVQPFALNDEWYFNMRFVDEMHGVTPLLSAVAPASTMERDDGPHSGNPSVRKMVADGKPQTTSWAYEREDGGRGIGFTGGHYHANWENDNARNLVLNGILWSADGRSTGSDEMQAKTKAR